jgi:hypothetical protein
VGSRPSLQTGSGYCKRVEGIVTVTGPGSQGRDRQHRRHETSPRAALPPSLRCGDHRFFVWPYQVFSLSLRDVELLLAELRDQFRSLTSRSKSDAPSHGGDALPASLGFHISPCCTTVVRDLECGQQKGACTDGPRRPSRLRNPPYRQAVRVPPRSEAEGPQGSATCGPSEVGKARSRPRARERSV